MRILKRPIISEKMAGRGEKLRQYGFVVDNSANKLQIKKAVEETYGVTVESVNTLVSPGKSLTRGTKSGFIKGKKEMIKRQLLL